MNDQPDTSSSATSRPSIVDDAPRLRPVAGTGVDRRRRDPRRRRGIHAEHPTLPRLFVARRRRPDPRRPAWPCCRAGGSPLVALAAVNVGAVVAWAITRIAGISWIDGLEQAEAPQFADTACAALGAVAAVAAVVAAVPPTHHVRRAPARAARRRRRRGHASWR